MYSRVDVVLVRLKLLAVADCGNAVGGQTVLFLRPSCHGEGADSLTRVHPHTHLVREDNRFLMVEWVKHLPTH